MAEIEFHYRIGRGDAQHVQALQHLQHVRALVDAQVADLREGGGPAAASGGGRRRSANCFHLPGLAGGPGPGGLTSALPSRRVHTGGSMPQQPSQPASSSERMACSSARRGAALVRSPKRERTGRWPG